MPVVRLGGRLGNQLFQVAFGLAQAALSNTPLLFDREGISNDQWQSLQNWTGPLASVDSETIDLLRGNRGLSGKLFRLIQRRIPSSRRTWVLQRSAEYRIPYLEPAKQAYFDGYWQSYRFFQAIETNVRSQLFFRPVLTGDQAKSLARVRDPGSLSLHVRRGDYVESGGFGSLPTEFYRQAVDWITSQAQIERIFVFSDDPGWCQNSLDLGRPFITIEGNTAEIDLLLMANCEHHIVGISTFSWWGAWLGAVSGRFIVAPSRWFPSYGAVPPLTDIYPQSWNLL